MKGVLFKNYVLDKAQTMDRLGPLNLRMVIALGLGIHLHQF